MRFGGGLGGRKAIKSKKQLLEEAARAAVEAEKARAAGVYGPAGTDRDSRFLSSCITFLHSIYSLFYL